MDYDTNSTDDILARLMKKMDQLEANNATFASTNQGLIRRVDDLEEQMSLMQARAEDMEMKMAVLRDSQLHNAVHRVFAITELLQRILLLCPAKQPLSLRNVSKTFRAAITGLPPLKTRAFSNSKDVLAPRKQGLLRRDLQPPLKLNAFFAESLQTPTSDCSAITFHFKAAPSLNATYWIRSDLSATFSIWMSNASELEAAAASMQTPLGRTYLTPPALPTSVRVTFPNRYRPRARSEHRLQRNGSTHFREDVSAIAEVGPSTVLDMMGVAQILERCYSCGEQVWTRTGDGDNWSPKSATDEERQLLGGGPESALVLCLT